MGRTSATNADGLCLRKANRGSTPNRAPPPRDSNAKPPTSTPPPSPAPPPGTSKSGNRLSRVGGLAAMVAGILLVAVASVTYTSYFSIFDSLFLNVSYSLFLNVSNLLSGLATLLLAVALPALRRLQAGRSRRLRLIGLVLDRKSV